MGSYTFSKSDGTSSSTTSTSTTTTTINTDTKSSGETDTDKFDNYSDSSDNLNIKNQLVFCLIVMLMILV